MKMNQGTLKIIDIGSRFKNDSGRVEMLFDLYTKMTGAPTSPSARRAKMP